MPESLIHRLYDQKKIDCPKWLPDNLLYLTLMGSRAYGCYTETSDWDYYGVCIPTRNILFPHESGLIIGFDDIPKFEQFKKEHFIDPDSGKDMEITIYGIVRYFELLFGGNPNVIETLFTNREYVVYSTPISEMIRHNRSLFLSKQSFYKTRSYAFSQLQKLQRVPVGKRLEGYNSLGFDSKFASHLARLIDNCEQILVNQDIDLLRNKEMVKAIRRGDWTIEQIHEYANQKEIYLSKISDESKLRETPNKAAIKALLMSCLEQHYGSLDKVIINPNKDTEILEKIRELVR